jgi:hypothetical protein
VGLNALNSLNLTNGYPNNNKNNSKKNNKVKSKPLELFELAGNNNNKVILRSCVHSVLADINLTCDGTLEDFASVKVTLYFVLIAAPR